MSDHDKEIDSMTGEVYSGPERREEQRRTGEDRRDMIRFEPEKTDRRTGKDRRDHLQSGWDEGMTI